MDGLQSLGSVIIQAFQKLPGVSDLLQGTNLATWETVAGILTLIAYILGIGVAIFGVIKFSIKKIDNDKNGSINNKSASSYLIGGLVGGGILILLPSIILIIGTVFGKIANT